MNKTIIALDTNIWIYLTQAKSRPLLEEIEKEIACGEFEIITNEIVVKEWLRNKPQTISKLEQSIKSELQSAYKVSNFITDKNSCVTIQRMA